VQRVNVAMCVKRRSSVGGHSWTGEFALFQFVCIQCLAGELVMYINQKLRSRLCNFSPSNSPLRVVLPFILNFLTYREE
jgi:hypothetical protein